MGTPLPLRTCDHVYTRLHMWTQPHIYSCSHRHATNSCTPKHVHTYIAIIMDTQLHRAIAFIRGHSKTHSFIHEHHEHHPTHSCTHSHTQLYMNKDPIEMLLDGLTCSYNTTIHRHKAQQYTHKHTHTGTQPSTQTQPHSGTIIP